MWKLVPYQEIGMGRSFTRLTQYHGLTASATTTANLGWRDYGKKIGVVVSSGHTSGGRKRSSIIIPEGSRAATYLFRSPQPVHQCRREVGPVLHAGEEAWVGGNRGAHRVV